MIKAYYPNGFLFCFFSLFASEGTHEVSQNIGFGDGLLSEIRGKGRHKKTSLEFRDSFGTDGTISGFSVLNQTSNTFKDCFDEFFDTRFIVGVSGFYLSLSDDAADGHCSVSHM